MSLENDDGDAAYRPCVGIALLNRAGQVFVARRRGYDPEHGVPDHAWQMPQGGIDSGEAPLDAARRELYEETNVQAASTVLLGQTDGWLRYDLPEDLLKPSWKGRYRAQTQRWFAFGFIGDDTEIDIATPGGGAHAPEFDAWRWEALERTPGLIIPFKRSVYESVAATFARYATWHAPS